MPDKFEMKPYGVIEGDLNCILRAELQLRLVTSPLPVIALALDMVAEKVGRDAINDEIYESVFEEIIRMAVRTDLWNYFLQAPA